MSIKVKFGEYSCENNELDKTDWLSWYNNGSYVDCQLVNTDILEPVLKVSAAYADATYVEIQDFNRFYFISNPESISGTHCLLHCHVDVLHTYRSGIGNMECLVIRNEDKTKMAKNVVDTNMILSKERRFKNRGFGDSLITNEVCYVIGMI